jgi:hypothetical protein
MPKLLIEEPPMEPASGAPQQGALAGPAGHGPAALLSFELEAPAAGPAAAAQDAAVEDNDVGTPHYNYDAAATMPAEYDCDICKQVEKWHTWFDGWEGGCYEGKCERCYRAAFESAPTDADMDAGVGLGHLKEGGGGGGCGGGDKEGGGTVETMRALGSPQGKEPRTPHGGAAWASASPRAPTPPVQLTV